jgi:hypothetical protein
MATKLSLAASVGGELLDRRRFGVAHLAPRRPEPQQRRCRRRGELGERELTAAVQARDRNCGHGRAWCFGVTGRASAPAGERQRSSQSPGSEARKGFEVIDVGFEKPAGDDPER